MLTIDLHIINKFDGWRGHQYEVWIYIWKNGDIVRSRHFTTRNPRAWAMTGYRLMEIQGVM